MPGNIQDQFSLACFLGDFNQVRDLLQEHADSIDVNQPDKEGFEPISSAVESGAGNIVQLLLDQGVAVNSTDNFGMTPLHKACLYGQENIAQILLAHGANVNARDQEGYTPLFRASRGNHQRIIRMLLAHRNIEVDAQSYYSMLEQQGEKSTPSIQGNFPSEGDIRKFLLDTIRSHYVRVLFNQHLDHNQLKEALMECFYSGDESHCPDGLMLPDDFSEMVKGKLSESYGQWAAKHFTHYIEQVIKPKAPSVTNDFLRFYQSVSLDWLLNTAIEEFHHVETFRRIAEDAIKDYLCLKCFPETADAYVEYCELESMIKKKGIGAIWNEIEADVLSAYTRQADGGVNRPQSSYSYLAEIVRHLPLTQETQEEIQIHLHNKLLQESPGREAFRAQEGEGSSSRSTFFAESDQQPKEKSEKEISDKLMEFLDAAKAIFVIGAQHDYVMDFIKNIRHDLPKVRRYESILDFFKGFHDQILLECPPRPLDPAMKIHLKITLELAEKINVMNKPSPNDIIANNYYLLREAAMEGTFVGFQVLYAQLDPKQTKAAVAASDALGSYAILRIANSFKNTDIAIWLWHQLDAEQQDEVRFIVNEDSYGILQDSVKPENPLVLDYIKGGDVNVYDLFEETAYQIETTEYEQREYAQWLTSARAICTACDEPLKDVHKLPEDFQESHNDLEEDGVFVHSGP